MTKFSGPSIEPVSETSVDPPVRGFLHRSPDPNGDGLVITHGAGGNCQGPLLVALAEAFAGAGFTVLRYNLPFRELRAFGPPRPAEAARNREGVKNAVGVMRQIVTRRIFAGGHSYGGRQTSMLCAEEPQLVEGLLLTSYPLHPPGKPDQLRVEHFSKIQVPVLIVQGTRDPFGSIAELEAAIKRIPAKAGLLPVEDAGHDLGFSGKKRIEELPDRVLMEFRQVLS
jgi:uncharacterized protein